MVRSTFSVLFYIKRSKLLKNGDAPVYLKITVNTKSVEISLKRSIEPRLWDTSKNRAKGSSSQAQELNNYLHSVQSQIYQHHKTLQESNKELSALTLKNAFLGIGEKHWGLIEMFQQHNQEFSKLVGIEYAPLTLKRYEASLKHLQTYIKNYYQLDDIRIDEVNHKFVSGYEIYLKSDASCAHNTSMKHMRALKKIILRAINFDIIRKNPFHSFKITTKAVERDRLTQEEIDHIRTKKIDIERVATVRDMFIFQCYTGLAYTDLASLTDQDIQLGMDGKKWIYIKRGKTGVPCQIPLLPIAEDILKKYANHPKCRFSSKALPVMSNQKMNSYLKEIADICSINKPLHTHLARHTFATTITLANGVPMETISKLLGHTKIQTTQLYSKVLDHKLTLDMDMLRQKIG